MTNNGQFVKEENQQIESESNDVVNQVAVISGSREVNKPPFVLTPNDTRDPSYSNLELPYRVVCRERLARQARVMKQQFRRELMTDELCQGLALSGVRLHREFTDYRVKIFKRSIIPPFTAKQKARLEELLAD